MTGYAEKTFRTQDDLEIYYRDYGDRSADGIPVLCLTGLTRNSRDFHHLATRLSSARRVICMDYRGRGRSAYDPDYRNYQPATYVRDILHLLAVTNLHRIVVIGTSLGGLLAMALGAVSPMSLAGIVLNDVGPEIAEEGRARIAAYIGNDVRMPDYAAAGLALQRQFTSAYPDLPEARWTELAHNIFTEDAAAGNLRLNYDLRLADALKEQAREPIPDLWPLFLSLRKIPVLAIRGGLSDVLKVSCFDRMKEAKPDMIQVTIANRGHVPILDEPESVKAIDEFLASL